MSRFEELAQSVLNAAKRGLLALSNLAAVRSLLDDDPDEGKELEPREPPVSSVVRRQRHHGPHLRSEFASIANGSICVQSIG
jgi:hypothetical protein